eukprot:CFRG5700T1
MSGNVCDISINNNMAVASASTESVVNGTQKRGINEISEAESSHLNVNEDVLNEKEKKKRLKKDPEYIKLRKRLSAMIKEQNVEMAVQIYNDLLVGRITIESQYYDQILYVLSGGNMEHVGESRTDLAISLFKLMRERNVKVGESSYTLLIRAFCLNKDIKEAEGIMATMRDRGVVFKLRTHSALLRGYCETDDKDKAYEKLAFIRDGFEVTESEYLPLLDLALRQGKMGEFDSLMADLREDVLAPTRSVWSMLEKRYVDSHTACTTAQISIEGKCSSCKRVLQSIDPPQEDSMLLLSRMEDVVVKCPDRVQAWRAYIEWLDKNKLRFDTVIDGANVGFWKKNIAGHAPTRIDYNQLNRMVTYLESQGRKVLIVLHNRHLRPEKIGSDENLGKQWQEREMLYTCETGHNDDWYWIYAAILFGQNAQAITNDEMRDHHFNLSEHRSFKRWAERHVTNFDFLKNEKTLLRDMIITPPTLYSYRIQVDDVVNWHCPDGPRSHPKETDSESDTVVTEPVHHWLCLVNKIEC